MNKSRITLTARRSTFVLLVILICLSVLLEILGVPVTFWDLTDSDDPFTTSIMMGLTVVSSPVAVSLLTEHLVSLTLLGPPYHYLGQPSVFRPPLF